MTTPRSELDPALERVAASIRPRTRRPLPDRPKPLPDVFERIRLMREAIARRQADTA